ncbi:MAG TPA: hypothetical protein VFV10_15925 [Gammaproteobacteria bacterium]|nr:hypothetical protein [Gammaproteobacteria bacterium]
MGVPRAESRDDAGAVARRMRRSVALVLAATWCGIAPAQDDGEFGAILASLGFRAQPRGVTTLQLFVGDGGYLDLPPRSVGNDLCLTERHYFEGSASIGYSPSGKPSRYYWLPPSPHGCAAESSADIPNEKTRVATSIPLDELAAIIKRTDELVDLTRKFPKCEDAPRFFKILEKPLHIDTLEKPLGSKDLVATLATPGIYYGPAVTFSFVDGEFVLHRVCQTFWDPIAHDKAWTFVLR